MAEKDDRTKAETPAGGSTNLALEWAKVLLPALISWPLAGVAIALLFQSSITSLADRFSQSTESMAEIGPVKIKFGAPVLPPQYRTSAPQVPTEIIDLSSSIGEVGDTGPEGTTVGFALAYAIQARAAKNGQKGLQVSARGIYSLAQKFDEFPGETYEGTSLLGGLQGMKKVGVYLLKDWPYASKEPPKASVKPAFKISAFRQAKSIPEILSALRDGNVVAATIEITGDFDHPEKDGRVILKLPLQTQGGKAIAIVGYNAATAEFKFANDWGAAWGQNGFGLIKDTDLARILVDGYTVDF
ncbi:C1 family peptidase [Rhodoferax sp. WC2427]|uniref:C1 family peptidase n=1 Tax=Rhodoferax sp. WC2427 TaxID=3234144 RepID=UPI0034666B45